MPIYLNLHDIKVVDYEIWLSPRNAVASLSLAYNRIKQQAITKLLRLIQLSIQMLRLVACVHDR